ncbi:MAG: polysaccharide lyase family protein [Acidobacteriaceae bacterium]
MPPMSFHPTPSALSAKSKASHKQTTSFRGPRTARLAWLTAPLLLCLIAMCTMSFAQNQRAMAGLHPETPAPSDPVTVSDDGTSFILSNGYLTATINKKTGDMTSLRVYELETQGYVSGHHAGYWEQNPNGAARMEAKVTIDPKTNGGKRAEVSIKGWSDGKNLNAGSSEPSTESPESEIPEGARTAAQVQLPPGVQRNRGTNRGPRPGAAAGTPGAAPGAAGAAPAPGGGGRGPGLLVDMEIRYSLGRGEKGIYTYAIFSHEPSYGATQIGESRYGMKLNGGVFDWLSIDSQRNMAMPTGADWDKGSDLNMKEARRLTTGVKAGQVEHKYDYCADQFTTPAYGWASTKQHVGIYFINPSVEFLSAGPNHFELTGHLDDGDGGDPTLLDYWRGSHYGGAILPIAAGEDWNKVVGPILIYVPSDATPAANFADAKRQAKLEADKWPYAWVEGVDYPKAAERATVSGQLILRDPQGPSATLPNLLVGLAYPDQTPAAAQPAQPGGRGPERMTWQNDAKHYEFWTRGSSSGRFTIHNVRPGTYELHAIADGVLGEYSKASITIKAGGEVSLGKLVWVPVRYGRQLWQIGIPNRSASEFLRGDDHWHWGEYIEYAKLFPNDVNFTIGKSDFRKDWFIYQVPHDELANDLLGRGQGRATPWRINFNLAQAPESGAHGILRLAIAGAGARSIAVDVNGQNAGSIEGLVYNATINRDGVEGSWVEKDLTFDASLLRAGENTLTLTVPAGGLTSGICYDVVRLELASGQTSAAR